MDTETLNQILQMVGQAGEGAYSLAIIYLAYPYFKSLVGLAAVAVVAKFFFRVFSAFTFARKAADAMGYEILGSEIYDHDRNTMLRILREKFPPDEEGQQ